MRKDVEKDFMIKSHENFLTKFFKYLYLDQFLSTVVIGLINSQTINWNNNFT